MRCCETINESVKVLFVLSGLFNCALCLEQDHRFEANLMFCRYLLFILIENKCLYDSVSFLKIYLNDKDIFGITVIAKLP